MGTWTKDKKDDIVKNDVCCTSRVNIRQIETDDSIYNIVWVKNKKEAIKLNNILNDYSINCHTIIDKEKCGVAIQCKGR